MMISAYSDPCYLLENTTCLSSDDFPAPFFPFPSPIFDAEDPLPNNLPLEDSFVTCALQDDEAPAKTNKQQETEVAPAKTNKRTLRTDRHSKIHTAQGLRDRRMRLSLDVARKFFDLQDLLGFDKASATVDWLITQSKDAIEKHLVHISKESSIVNSHSAPIAARSSAKKKLLPHKEKEKESRRGAFHQLLTRKSRVEARARARERTKEKQKKEILVEVDGGEAAGQLQSIANLVYHTNEKEECPNRVEGIDYEYLPMSMAGQLSHHPNISYCNYSKDYSIRSNEENMNFFQYGN